MNKLFSITLITALIFGGCSSADSPKLTLDLETVQDSTNIIYSITGLDGPEAVRYDPEQNVYFISNFTGSGNDQDSTGFITKADAEGNIQELKFMKGTEETPLHAPRGMFIVNETLWAADVLGVHGFNKNTGQHTDFVDFTEFEIGFLNDISVDKNGILYVTDTGNPRVYKVEEGSAAVYLDSLEYAPNGITLNPENSDFILAPWGGAQTFHAFNSDADIYEFATLDGGYFDGIEFIGSNLFSASQQDSSIRVFNKNAEKALIKTIGRPADIGINTQLNHIAVPYIALDRVDIWKLSE